MKAVALSKYLPISDPESLFDCELNKPIPHKRDVLVKIEAVSVNPVDTKIRSPKSQVEDKPKVLGWDACGTVTEVGDSTSLFKEGDRVFYAGDITRAGSNSEYQLVDERIVGRAPNHLSAEEAAAMPLTTITAWEALFDRMQIEKDKQSNKGKALLIIGGAGGVGSIAIQIAAKFAGLKVIATASKPESIAWCEQMGAQHVINHYRDIHAQLSELGIGMCDYILCCNSTDMHFETMVEVIKPQGSICCIVDNTAPLPIEQLKAKSARLAWEFMFTRSMFQTNDMIEQHHILNKVAELLDQGVLKTTLTQTLKPMNAATLRTAHEILEAGKMVGKLVISV